MENDIWAGGFRLEGEGWTRPFGTCSGPNRFSVPRLAVEGVWWPQDCLLFAKCVFLLASLGFIGHFQLSRKQFAAGYEGAGMRLSTSDHGPQPEKDGGAPSRSGMGSCASGGVEGSSCVSDGQMELEMVRWIRAALALMQTVLQPVRVVELLVWMPP